MWSVASSRWWWGKMIFAPFFPLTTLHLSHTHTPRSNQETSEQEREEIYILTNDALPPNYKQAPHKLSSFSFLLVLGLIVSQDKQEAWKRTLLIAKGRAWPGLFFFCCYTHEFGRYKQVSKPTQRHRFNQRFIMTKRKGVGQKVECIIQAHGPSKNKAKRKG